VPDTGVEQRGRERERRRRIEGESVIS